MKVFFADVRLEIVKSTMAVNVHLFVYLSTHLHRVQFVRCADYLSHSYFAYDNRSLEAYTSTCLMQTPKLQS
jgi:hypothetical protein